MNIKVIEKNINEIESDFELIFILQKDLKHSFIKDKELLNRVGYKSSNGETIVLLEQKRIYCGVENIDDLENFKIAGSNGVKEAKKYGASSLAIATYDENNKFKFTNAILEGLILGDYSFQKYKSEKKDQIKKIYISIENYYEQELNRDLLSENIEEIFEICDSVNFVRDTINCVPCDIYPETLAKVAKKMAKDRDLEIKVLDEKELGELDMNAMLSVGRASTKPPRLIHLTKKVKNPKLKIALVGKGLTYDSGGLSLKPSDSMVTMKADKSGGCAVLGIMRALSLFDLDIELHGIVGAVENMIGGDAYKPDDILVARNKKTIEVRNTDAEGRLVLADCLCYVQDFVKPDYIIDLATLTGACVVALGEYSSGIMGHSEKLKKSMLKASKRSGELAVELPFNRYLKELIASKIADVCNISSSRYGGAITAGLFLSEFIKEENKDKWLHIDIAGPAFVEKEWGYNPHGASGAGVRMLTDWIKEINSKGTI